MELMNILLSIFFSWLPCSVEWRVVRPTRPVWPLMNHQVGELALVARCPLSSSLKGRCVSDWGSFCLVWSGPVRSGPVRSGPARSGLSLPGLAWPGPTWPVWFGWFGLIWFDLVWFGLIWFDLVWFGLIWFKLVWSGFIWFYLVFIWFDLVWSVLIRFDLVWSGLIWFDLVWSGLGWFSGLSNWILLWPTDSWGSGRGD